MSSTSNKITGVFKDLPGWAKGVIALIIVIVIIVIVYVAYQNLKGKTQEQKDVRDVKDDLNSMISQGIKPSYTDSYFDGWAAELIAAFDGCGTDLPPVFRVFSNMKNEADILKLLSIYGTRPYSACGWGTNSFSLPRAISDELDASEVAKINAMFASKGIQYRF